MNVPFLRALALAAGLTSLLHGEEDAPRSSMKEMLKARIAEDARKVEPRKAPPIAPSAQAPAPAATSQAPKTQDAAPAPATAASVRGAAAPASGAAVAVAPGMAAAAPTPPAPPTAAAAAKENPTVLPKVEVKKGRITVLDQKLAKQEEDIARERRNLKTSETDTALNDAKVAKPLAIFGGESSQFRQRVASERVQLMEAEKDIIEAIARAKTKEEKKELQKQLDEIKAFRRDLDKSLR